MTARKTDKLYVLPFKSDHRNVVRYQNADGVNFYMPKDDLPDASNPPGQVTLTVAVG